LRELQAWVSAILPGAVVKASMSDTGIGIPPEELDRVFDRFYQVEHGGREPAGSGLGLSIVKQLVEAQDGAVTVDSHPSQGTTFRFSLPVATS
jgi:signal transduction histidine kinase